MIGIIGCGSMGSAMAMRLLEQGKQVIGYDPSQGATDRLEELGASVAADIPSLVADATLVILSLPNASVVKSVVAELHEHMRTNQVVLDTSTSEPDVTKALAVSAQKAGYYFVDGPVSGGPAGARTGTMTMILGGDAEAIESIRPVLSLLTAKCLHIGPSGAGHVAKIANNLLCAANLALVSEMARLAESQGVELSALLEGVNAGSGRSGVSEVNFPRWILSDTFDSGFTMGLMRKDVNLAAKLADSANLHLPATTSIVGLWNDSRADIDDTQDFNCVYHFEPTPHA